MTTPETANAGPSLVERSQSEEPELTPEILADYANQEAENFLSELAETDPETLVKISAGGETAEFRSLVQEFVECDVSDLENPNYIDGRLERLGFDKYPTVANFLKKIVDRLIGVKEPGETVASEEVDEEGTEAVADSPEAVPLTPEGAWKRFYNEVMPHMEAELFQIEIPVDDERLEVAVKAFKDIINKNSLTFRGAGGQEVKGFPVNLTVSQIPPAVWDEWSTSRNRETTISNCPRSSLISALDRMQNGEPSAETRNLLEEQQIPLALAEQFKRVFGNYKK